MLAALTIQVLLGSLAYGDVNEKLRLGLSPSSSNYPGLQAPFESAAASAVPKTFRPHGPDDEDNLERLCNDPFHSFLCKPVTPRRSRFDGKLRASAVIPPGILPAASNLREFSQPPQSGKDLLRNSKSYLPPSNEKVVKIKTEPRYEPPYLSNDKTLSNNYGAEESKFSSDRIPLTLNSFQNEQKQKKLAKTPINEEKIKEQTVNYSQKQAPLNQLSRKYLPIDESVSAASTNLSPSIENISLKSSATQNRENKEEHHSLERLCNDPFHSFLCKPGKRRKRIDGRIRPEAKIPPNVLIGASSIVREARVFPSQSRSAQAAQKSISLNYLPTNTDKPTPTFTTQYTTSYPPQQTYALSQGSSGGYNYPKPSNNQIFTYPTPSTTSTTTRRPTTNGYYYQKPLNDVPTSKPTSPAITTQNILKPINTNPTALSTNIQQNIISSSSGYHYLPPSNGLTLPTRPPPPTYQTTSQQVTASRPSFSNLYPGSTNIQQTIVSGQNGYYYPKPSPAIPTTVQVIQTTTTKPYFTTQRPTTASNQYSTGFPGGYTYPRPSDEYGLQTTQKPDNAFYQTSTIRPPTSSTSKPFYNNYQSPSNVQANVFNSGYNYQKPSNPLPLPSSTLLPTYTTTLRPDYITTKPTSFQYYQPSNTQTTVVRPTRPGGYTYAKPANTYTQTTLKPVQSIYTTTKPIYQQLLAINNQFSNQANLQQTVVSSSGYNYEKPSVQLTFPTTTEKPTIYTFPTSATRPIISITTNVKPTVGYQYPKPTNIQQNFVPPANTGYTYSKPTLGFTNPTTQQPQTTARPTTITTENPSYQTFPTRPSISITTDQKPTFGYQYPKPTNVQENVVRPAQSGYIYSKPPVSFTYPTTQKPQITTTPAIFTTEKPTFPTFQNFPTRPSISITTNQKPTSGYQYPKPTNIQESVFNPSQTGYTYSKPSNGFTYPTTQRPQTFVTTRPTVITTQRPILEPNPTNIQQNVAQNGYSYPKPSNSFSLPDQKPYTFPPSQITTLSTVVTQTPPIKYPYPKPTNVQENILPPNQGGYVYDKPSYTFQTTNKPVPTYPTTTRRPPYFTTLQPTNNYETQKPTNTYSNGYYYSKPSKPFPKPSTPKPSSPSPTIQTFSTNPTTYPTTQSSVGYQYPKPTNIKQTVISPSQNGYIYQKPQTSFTLPTTKKPVIYTVSTVQTTNRPDTTYFTTKPTTLYDYPNPTNIQQNIITTSKQPGYSYARPSSTFNYPTSQAATTIRPQTTSQRSTVGYQYPKPSNAVPSIVPQASQQPGYNYQKPSIDFPYPRPTSGTTTYTRPLNSFQYPKPKIPQSFGSSNENGFVYQRPSKPTARPSAAPIDEGYQYQKPSRPFTLPPRKRSASQLSENTRYRANDRYSGSRTSRP